MKKSVLSLLFLILCTSKAFAWQSESGGGVVSANSNVAITSVEAVQVLKSDLLSVLLGTTQLGGSVNYASFNSGGVLSTKNVVTSRDVAVLNSDQYASWGVVNGKSARIGLSADNTFVVPDGLIGSGVSFNTVSVPAGGLLRSSGDTVFSSVSMTNVKITGTLSVSGNTALVGGLQQLKKTTVAGLPAVSINTAAVYMVSDANSASDCTTGGGTQANLCFSSGVGVWVDA